MTASTSKKRMHTAYTRRSRCRGTYYRGYVFAFVRGVVERTGCSFSHAVNLLLEKTIGEKLAEIEEQLRYEVRREKLLAEERSLRERLRVILRSGAYLKEYAEKLLLGDPKQVFHLKKRVGIYAHVSPKELNVVLRILKRREDVVAELLDIEDKLLPGEPYPFMVTERGWKIGDSIYTRDKFRALKPMRRTGQSKQKTGGEKET